MIFIRPWALALILLWPLLVFVRRRVRPDNPWKRVIDAAFLPYLMVQTGAKSARRTGLFIGLVWTMLCVAAAGPAFEKIPVDTVVKRADTVIVADLSPAVSGSVLAQMRVKLYELLQALKGDNVGLVLYDTKGYVISPLTPDTGIIRDMVPALTPDILPEPAQYPVRGFEKAAALLGPDNKNGRIIFVTAGGFNEAPVAQLARYLPYKIGVLGIGNATTGVPMPLPSGGFVRDTTGQPVLARADADRLSKIGTYEFARADGTEIPVLLNATQPQIDGSFTGEESVFKADTWHDLGAYVVVLCLPFVALLFRKGVFFAFVLLWGLGANAAWFERPDQIEYKRDIAGVEAYRAGDYDKAADLFGAGQADENHYNLGNALAYLGQYQQAIDAYTAALEQNPGHTDAAFNKKYLEDQLQQNGGAGNRTQNAAGESPETESQSDSKGAQSEKSDNATEQSGGDDGAQSEQSDAQTDTPQPDEQQKSGEEESPAVPQPKSGEQQTGEEQNETAADAEKQGSQQTQQLFNRLKKDPSRVLRYRINRQHQNAI